jgi:tetratricopeptide (TPR) repeat protein
MFVLAYAGIFYFAGNTPGAFHFFNVLFHAASTGMVFLLTLRFWRKESMAFIAALLFALHPVHVEPVAWIAALSELAVSFFVLTAVFFYSENRSARWPAVAALSSYAMALLWKESAVAFVPIAVLYDILVVGRWPLKRWLGIVAVTLAYFGMRAMAVGGFAPAVLYPNLSLATQIFTAITNVGFYLWKLLAPVGLSAFYELEFVHGITLTVAAVVVLTLLSIWKLRERNAWAASWILVSLFPVLLVSRIAVPLADRDLYLPSVGFVWLAAIVIERLGRRRSFTLLTVLVVAYGALTLQRLPVWRDDLPLLESELRENPDSQSLRLLLVSELGRRGKYDDALFQLNEVLKRNPNSLDALVNKAGILSSVEDWAGVRSVCAQVFVKDSNSPRCLLNVGYADAHEGRLADAHAKFARAFQYDPSLSHALLQQGVVEARMGNLSAAVRTLESAVALNPTAPALNNLGSLYANRGEMKKAVQAFQNAVRVDPSFEVARQNLEKALADARQSKSSSGISKSDR